MNEIHRRAISGVVYIVIMWFGASYSNFSCRLLFAILGIISIYEMWKLRKEKSKFLAFIYILTPFILIQFILTKEGQENWNSNLILFMFILTWIFDTFAYIVGVKFGKHKIMPSISPKKSWEGFAAGFVFTIIASYLSYSYFTFETILMPLSISIILPFTATLGDFIESYYKREAGVKDSGGLMPGHGGMLDRMDAFMITIPAIYILTKLL
ncbi:MAG: phosphatidate cytidylyltransferase [Bacteroidota bacterium]|nr:phosphatidate cytidylyltransferase [Bacteroidota bacterium]